MLSTADISKLRNIFVTKDEFNELRSDVHQILFEVRKLNEEVLVTNYRQSKHTDMLDNHDDRLRALEKKMGLQ